MFDVSLAWWEFVARAALIYLVLLLFVRLSGKRTVGQFTPFDLLVVLLIGEAVSNGLSGGDESVIGGLIAAATLIGLNLLLASASARSRAIDIALEGEAVLLGRKGKVYKKALQSHRITEGDIEKALREADCELSEMESLMLESDGNISVSKRK
jgi:uncharacterized membrane protein YcaP (DUF421 family)